jgi:hypothetical protein
VAFVAVIEVVTFARLCFAFVALDALDTRDLPLAGVDFFSTGAWVFLREVGVAFFPCVGFTRVEAGLFFVDRALALTDLVLTVTVGFLGFTCGVLLFTAPAF